MISGATAGRPAAPCGHISPTTTWRPPRPTLVRLLELCATGPGSGGGEGGFTAGPHADDPVTSQATRGSAATVCSHRQDHSALDSRRGHGDDFVASRRLTRLEWLSIVRRRFARCPKNPRLSHALHRIQASPRHRVPRRLDAGVAEAQMIPPAADGPAAWAVPQQPVRRREEGRRRRGGAQDAGPAADDARAAAAEGPPQALEAVRDRRLLPPPHRLVQELQPRLHRQSRARRRAVPARARLQLDRDQPSVRRLAVEHEHAAPPRADVQPRRGHVGPHPGRRLRQPGPRLDADGPATSAASTPTTNLPPLGAFGDAQGPRRQGVNSDRDAIRRQARVGRGRGPARHPQVRPHAEPVGHGHLPQRRRPRSDQRHVRLRRRLRRHRRPRQLLGADPGHAAARDGRRPTGTRRASSRTRPARTRATRATRSISTTATTPTAGSA